MRLDDLLREVYVFDDAGSGVLSGLPAPLEVKPVYWRTALDLRADFC